MGVYNSSDLQSLIDELRDSIVLTNNASLALCWLVELFNAIQALESGIKGTFTFTTFDARKQILKNNRDNRLVVKLIKYRNLYVHTGRFRASHKAFNLQEVQYFANKYCHIYIDFNSKTFDTV